MTRGHSPSHFETTQVLREAITEDDDADDDDVLQVDLNIIHDSNIKVDFCGIPSL